jgi:hypothetical protein
MTPGRWTKLWYTATMIHGRSSVDAVLGQAFYQKIDARRMLFFVPCKINMSLCHSVIICHLVV